MNWARALDYWSKTRTWDLTMVTFAMGYRRFSINYHRVFYRFVGESLEIVRVLHESMDIDTHLEILTRLSS